MNASKDKNSIDGVLWMQNGKKKLGEVNVVGQNSPPNWSPGDGLIIGRKDGGKIPGDTYLLDCGSNGRYRVHGPGDSPDVATNSLAVGVLNVI